jgi:hypothetical protein
MDFHPKCYFFKKAEALQAFRLGEIHPFDLYFKRKMVALDDKENEYAIDKSRLF